MMTPELISGVIQGGAVFLLAMVLWGISKKIDTLLLMAQSVVNRLLDLIMIATTDNATRTQEQTDAEVTNTRPQK